MKRLFTPLRLACLAGAMLGAGVAAAALPTPNLGAVLVDVGLGEIHVGTNAALQAFRPGLLQALAAVVTPTTVHRDGFYQAGDTPPASYVYAAMPCATPDNGAQVPAAAGGCWTLQWPALPDVRIWGAKMDGTTGQGGAVQAAVNAICAKPQPGGVLGIPAGRVAAVDITTACSIKLQGTTGGNGAAGTTWDYSGATDHAFQVKPAGWPAVTQFGLVFAPEVSGIDFYTSTSGNTARAVDFVGVNAGRIHDLSFSGLVYNAIRGYGYYKLDVFNVTGNYWANSNGIGGGISNYVVELVGDMSGQGRNGNVCSLGDCSTRSDIATLRNIDSLGTNTGSGIKITGTVGTTMGEHISIENKNRALDVSCPTGLPDVRYCPQFITFVDFQGEGAVGIPFYLHDFSDFQCSNCYAVGSGGNANDIDASLVSYGQTGGSGGGFRWTGGRIANASGSCAYVNVSDTKIVDTVINDCNLGNTGGVGIDYARWSTHLVSGNTIGYLIGTTPPAMGGILVESAAFNVQSVDNTYFGTTSGLNNNSAMPYTVTERGNRGPGGAPSAGSCGTGPSVVGTDRSMLVTVGSGSPSSCTVNFGSTWPLTPRCTSMAAPGSSNVGSMSGSTTSLSLSAPTSGGSYQLLCIGNE